RQALKAKPSYVAFILVAGHREPILVNLGSAGEIDALVERWRRVVSAIPNGVGGLTAGKEGGEGARASESGILLRQAIWDPVSSVLHGSRRVFIVLDGALNLVNLAALPSGDGGYLVETAPTFHHLSAARDTGRHGGLRGAAQELLVSGGPDYEKSSRRPAPVEDAPPAAIDSSKSPGVRPATYRSASIGCASFVSVHFDPLLASAR